MATQTYYFSGEAVFPHLIKPDTKFDQAGIWHISVILDDASKAEYAASGMRVGAKIFEGKETIKFSRPVQKLMKNELVKFEKPVVIDSKDQPLTALIGNGSKVTVKVIVFDTMRGKGHRLEAVKVNELIEYKPEPKPEAANDSPGSTVKKAMPF